MKPPSRRDADALRAVDGLLDAHLRQAAFGGRPLANLATAMAIDFTGADRGILLLDEGRGLEPALALDQDLSATPSASYDTDIIADAVRRRELVQRENRVAAPVVVGGLVRGMLYLESDDQRFGEEAQRLAGAIGTRIATLIRSADLVDELARRTQDMETLEALGAVLASGKLRSEHLDRTVEGTAMATTSTEALLVLLDSVGEPLTVKASGQRTDELRAMVAELTATLAEPDYSRQVGQAIRDPHLFEVLWTEPVPAAGRTARRAVGFFLTRRRDGSPYGDADRSFFRAVAHLLSGALARVDYFNKAAEDPLTETGSRLALQLSLAEAKAAAIKTGQAFSVVLVDIDHFKDINDRYGHLTGDLVLKGVAESLRSRLRGQDSVARFGGDEFVIILPATGSREARHLAEELCRLVTGHAYTDEGIRVTVSIGVATFSFESSEFGEVLKRADEALYQSKSGGRNRVTVAEPPDRGGGR